MSPCRSPGQGHLLTPLPPTTEGSRRQGTGKGLYGVSGAGTRRRQRGLWLPWQQSGAAAAANPDTRLAVAQWAWAPGCLQLLEALGGHSLSVG